MDEAGGAAGRAAGGAGDLATARTASVLVNDVSLADAQRVLRTEQLLFAEPRPGDPLRWDWAGDSA
ncbi:hypothetical protein GCM10009759_69020 [Kitasatospora saccharophila]|uniref:Uncharacterized protein n=1 Tax=Kitasatospora saccharophila TaxID=407973 RepID=A0ABP5JU74_9ACTN